MASQIIYNAVETVFSPNLSNIRVVHPIVLQTVDKALTKSVLLTESSDESPTTRLVEFRHKLEQIVLKFRNITRFIAVDSRIDKRFYRTTIRIEKLNIPINKTFLLYP